MESYQPEDLTVNLYKHQLTSVQKLETLERNQVVETVIGLKETTLGAFTDRAGSGKTLSMLTLILRDMMEWYLESPFITEITKNESAGLVKKRIIQRYRRLRPTLILVNNVAIPHWETEAKCINLIVYTVKSKNDIAQLKIDDYDIVIVCPNMYNQLISSYANCAWKRFIFDDPDHVDVPNMKRVIAGFIWFISSTPSAIWDYHRSKRNSFIKEIMDTNDTNFDNVFEGMIVENSDGYINASINIPDIVYLTHKCLLHNKPTPSNVFQLVETGDVAGAIALMGGQDTNDIAEFVKTQVTDKTNLQIEETFKERLESNCHICLDNLTNPVFEKNCQNLFCGICLLNWLQQSDKCPLCREIIDPSTLVHITQSAESDKLPTQLEIVSDIIKKRPDGHILIYLHFDDFFDSLKTILRKNKIPWSHLVYKSKQIETIISQFHNGDTRVLILSPESLGVGLDLSKTTDLIFCHKVRRDIHRQIIGRAHRIGRLSSLNVHELADVI